MKYRELPALNDALAELVDMPLPIATAMKVRRIVRALTPQLQDLWAEEQKLVTRHVKMDPEGKPVIENNQFTFETEEAQKAFSAERQELWELEWQPPERITLAELGGREIKARLLIGLGDVLDEETGVPVEPSTKC